MNKQYNDLIKDARKAGKLKNASEAFKSYPTEEEWHKGKIENVISERPIIYNNVYKTGDIVFVKEYKYPDGKAGKNHMFVIIDQENRAVPIENICMLISSNLKKLKYSSNILLKKDNKNNLKVDSLVKTDEIYIIYSEDILFKVGTIDKDILAKYKDKFYSSIK